MLPGFGRPLNYVPQGDPDFAKRLFPNALSQQDIRPGHADPM